MHRETWCCCKNIVGQDCVVYLLPCPTNSSIVGYTNLMSLNLISLASPQHQFTTTFKVESGQAMVPAIDKSFFSCSQAPDPADSFIFLRGSFQVCFLNVYAFYVYFHGITCWGDQTATVSGDAHSSLVAYFIYYILR